MDQQLLSDDASEGALAFEPIIVEDRYHNAGRYLTRAALLAAVSYLAGLALTTFATSAIVEQKRFENPSATPWNVIDAWIRSTDGLVSFIAVTLFCFSEDIDNAIAMRVSFRKILPALVYVQATCKLCILCFHLGKGLNLDTFKLQSPEAISLVIQCLAQLVFWGMVGGSFYLLIYSELAHRRERGSLASLTWSELALLRRQKRQNHTRLFIKHVGIIRSLLSRLGFKKSPGPAEIRLEWPCHCGKSFFDDVFENSTVTSTELEQIIKVIKLVLEQRARVGMLNRSSNWWSYMFADDVTIIELPTFDVDDSTGASRKSQKSEDNNNQNRHSSIASPDGGQQSNTVNKRTKYHANPSEDGDASEEDAAGSSPNMNMSQWLIVVMPVNGIDRMMHIDLAKHPTDLAITIEMRRLFTQLNSRHRKLLRLLDAASIRATKFHLRKGSELDGRQLRTIDIPAKLTPYTLPERRLHRNWRVESQEISIESLPGFMMSRWHQAEHAVERPESRFKNFWRTRYWLRLLSRVDRLPRHSNPLKATNHWWDHIIAIRVSLYRSSQLYTHENTNIENMNFGIDIQFDSDAFHITQEVPRRIRQQLTSDAGGRKPVIGWGLWIEEGWIVPWYAFVVENIIPSATLITGLALTAKYGIGYMAIAAYGVALLGLLRAQWSAKTKDSKR